MPLLTFTQLLHFGYANDYGKDGLDAAPTYSTNYLYRYYAPKSPIKDLNPFILIIFISHYHHFFKLQIPNTSSWSLVYDFLIYYLPSNVPVLHFFFIKFGISKFLLMVLCDLTDGFNGFIIYSFISIIFPNMLFPEFPEISTLIPVFVKIFWFGLGRKRD